MGRAWQWLWPEDLHARGWMDLRSEAQIQQPTAIEPVDGRLRVVTYNVHWRRSRDVDALATSMQAHPELAAADVVLLQEAESHPSEPCARTEALATALGLGFVYVPVVACEDGTQGNAILTRYPIEHARFLPLRAYPVMARPHPRAAVEVTLKVGGIEASIYNVHLDTRLDFDERWRQLLPVVEAAAAQPGPAVLGGDFNTLPFRWWRRSVPRGVERQAGRLDACLRELGLTRATPRTKATHESGLRLDSVYLKGLEPRRAKVLYEVTCSDHYPVLVEANISGHTTSSQS